MAGRRAKWEIDLERRLWELLEDAPHRDAAPLARTLMDLKRGQVSAGQARSKLGDLDKKRAAREAARKKAAG